MKRSWKLSFWDIKWADDMSTKYKAGIWLTARSYLVKQNILDKVTKVTEISDIAYSTTIDFLDTSKRNFVVKEDRKEIFNPMYHYFCSVLYDLWKNKNKRRY
jgi:hypothetical protein